MPKVATNKQPIAQKTRRARWISTALFYFALYAIPICMLTLSLLQSELVWEDPAANRQRFDHWLERCDPDTDLVVLPEMFSTGFSMRSHELAEDPADTTHRWMQGWADRLDAAVTGSYIVRENGQTYNRLLWVEPGGQYYHYDKHHLFGMAGEHKAYAPGQTPLQLSWRGWVIRPLICYDLRFPLWARNKPPYYDLLLYVANWPETRARHWRTLLQARAIENQACVVGVNRVGTDHNGLAYRGDTSVYDHGGQLLYHSAGQESLGHCRLEREAMHNYREKLPFLRDEHDFTIHLNRP